MRFLSSKAHASATPTSNVRSPSSTAPPASHVPWRSLWSRVYTRWATTAPPTTPATFVEPASVHVHELPKQLPAHTRHYPHLRLREYWQRKRGELWFVTKRREDGDIQSSPTSSSDGHAEEVEVVPPPQQRRSRGRRRITLFRLRSKSQRSTRPSSLQSHDSSEIEIAMSSFSLSSSDSDSDDSSDQASRQEGDEEDEMEVKQPRDSYEHEGDDPFLQRYSSWYSIDDEQQSSAVLPEDEGDDESKSDNAEDRGVSPTLDALYGVRHVDVGVPSASSPGGIWV